MASITKTLASKEIEQYSRVSPFIPYQNKTMNIQVLASVTLLCLLSKNNHFNLFRQNDTAHLLS
jgi:hypothetical protein